MFVAKLTDKKPAVKHALHGLKSISNTPYKIGQPIYCYECKCGQKYTSLKKSQAAFYFEQHEIAEIQWAEDKANQVLDAAAFNVMKKYNDGTYQQVLDKLKQQTNIEVIKVKE